MQDEEKEQLAAASLDYNLDHAQLKAMFQKELTAAKASSKQSRQTAAPEQGPMEPQAAPASLAQSTGDESTSSAAQQSSDVSDHSQTRRLDSMQITDSEPAESGPAGPAALQSAALQMLQRQLSSGQPEQALLQVEAALRYASHHMLAMLSLCAINRHLRMRLRCRPHQSKAESCSALLLLKAQAVAMIGDLAAAIEVLQEWQAAGGGETCLAALKAGSPSSWQTAWQKASDAKASGNEMFRKGNLQGNVGFQLNQRMQSLSSSCASNLPT